MRKKQLFSPTPKTFQLPSHIDRNGRVVNLDADSVPMILWPDGRWCVLANAYMLELASRGLARKIGGGTLATYATNISHILRFCFYNNIALHEISDNTFTFFINTLKAECHDGRLHSRVRKADAVIAIGRATLSFLCFVGKKYQIVDLVGVEGQIVANQKVGRYVIGAQDSANVGVHAKFWHHRSFPMPDPKVRRLPISSDMVERIRNSIHLTSKTIFLRKRRFVMLKLLEITGGRRAEITALQVRSVYEAQRMAEPMLKIPTVKAKGDRETFRLLPISRHDIEYLIEFIEKNRARVIRKTCRTQFDDGRLLISQTTGLGLMPNTLTQEISTLAKAAGVTGKSCPHMFRHRFITKLFVALIEHHKFRNADSFRQALLDVESIKQKVQQWTGHRSISSLNVYINLAFDEVTQFSKTYNAVRTQQIIESYKVQLVEMRTELDTGVGGNAVLNRLMNSIEALESDLSMLCDPDARVQKTVE